MSIFIPGGKAGGGGLESFWYDSTIAYPTDAYIYYWDFERPDWVTMYHNKSGADTAPGPFDPLLWERKGSFNDTPWSMEYAQTGLVYGGKVSKTGSLQYKVEAGNGIIFGVVDATGSSDTINVNWQETINTVDFTLSSTVYLFMDRNGTINTLNNPPSSNSYRSMIYLGVIVQDPFDPTQIGGITFAPYANYISQQTMQDLHRRLFTPCMDGGHVDPKAGTMKLSHGILKFYSYTSNWEVDTDDPHMRSITAVDPIEFTEVDSNFNVIRSKVTDIDPTNWENSGNVEPLPSNDKVTVNKLFYSIPLQKYFLQLGQNIYDTLGDARESFETENYNYAKPLTSMANAIIIAYIIIRKDTVALDDKNKCEVKNGGCSFASGASSAIEYLKDLLDTNIIPPLKNDQHLSYNTTSSVWENKFPNPFVRYYEQTAKNDVVEMDAVYYDSGEWKKAIADDVTTKKFAQGIAVNIQSLSGPPAPVKPTSGTSTNWTGGGAEPMMASNNIGYWLDISTEVGYTGTFPLTLAAPVSIVVGMSDGTTRTITFPAKKYPDAATTDGGSSTAINSLGYQVFYDGLYLASPVDSVNPFEDGGKLYIRVDVQGTSAVWPISKGAPPALPSTTSTNVLIDVVMFGILTKNAHGFDIGATYYLSDTVPGGVTKTAPARPTSFQQPIFSVLNNNEILVSNSTEGGDRDAIVKNPLTNAKNVISPDTDINPLTIVQAAGAKKNPLTIESSLANYNFTPDGKFIIEDSTVSPAVEHSSIEVGRTASSPILNALRLYVNDASGSNPVALEMINGESRPIWDNRKLELDITDFDPTIGYNKGDKVIYPINAAPEKLRYEIWRAINDTPAGAWNKNQWEKISGTGCAFRGWFDPFEQNGGDRVSFDVVNNSNNYSEDDYVISISDGTYNFTTGQPDAAGIQVKEGERIVYTSNIWGIISPIIESPKMKGWFDPQVTRGGSQVIATVENNSSVYTDGDYIIASRDGRYDFLNAAIGGSTSATSDIHLGERWKYINNAWTLASPIASVPDRVRMKGWFDPLEQNGGDDVEFSVFNNTTDYTDGDYVISLNDGTYNFATGQPGAAGTPIKEGERISFSQRSWTVVDQIIVQPKMVGWFDPTQDNGGPNVDENVHNGGAFQINDYVIATSNGFYNFATGKTSATAAPLFTRIGGGQRWSYDGSNWNVVADVPTLFKGWLDPSQDGGGTRVPDPVQDGTADYVDGCFIIAEGSANYDFTSGTSVAPPNGVAVEAGEIFRYNGVAWQLMGAYADPNNVGFFDPTNAGGKGTVTNNILNGSVDYRNGHYAIAIASGKYDFITGQPDTGAAVGSPAPAGVRISSGSRIVYDGTSWSVLSAGSGLAKGFMDASADNGGAGVNFPIVNGTNDYNGNEFVIVDTPGKYNFATGRTDPVGTNLRKNDAVVYDGSVWKTITGENTFYQHPMSGIINPNDEPTWKTNPEGYTFFVTNTSVYKWSTDINDIMLGGGLSIPPMPPCWVYIFGVGLSYFWNGYGETHLKVKERRYVGLQDGQCYVGPDAVYRFHRNNKPQSISYEVGEKFDIPTPLTATGSTKATQNGEFPNKAALDALPADGSIKVNELAITTDNDRGWLYLGDNLPAGNRWKDTGIIADLPGWYKQFNFKVGNNIYFESIKEVPTGNPNDVSNLVSASNKVGDHLVTDDAVWEWTDDLGEAALWSEPNAIRLGHGETTTTGIVPRRGIAGTETRLPAQWEIRDGVFSLDGDVIVTKDTGHAWIFDKGVWKDTGNFYSVPTWIKKFDLLTREVIFRNSFELNSDSTPLSSEVGEPGQYMVTGKAVWKWVTDQKLEAQSIASSKVLAVGEWVGDSVLAPTARFDRSSLQDGDYYVNNSYGILPATISGVPAPEIPPAAGTDKGWMGSLGGKLPIDPLQVGVWSEDISLKINCANLPFTITKPVTLTVYMNDRTARTITLPADTYQHAAMIPPGTSSTEKSVGMTLANDPLFATELSGVMIAVEGGKTYLRVDGYVNRADAIASYAAVPGAGAPPAKYGTIWPISIEKPPITIPAALTGAAASNTGGWKGIGVEPPVSAGEYGYWLDISHDIGPGAAPAWTAPMTQHTLRADLFIDIVMSSGPDKYVKINLGKYSNPQDLGTSIKSNLDAKFPGDFSGVFVTVNNNKVWIRLDTINTKPRVVGRSGITSDLTHNSRVYYYSAGNWIDSGVDVTSKDTFTKGGMWFKEFDTDIPIWDNTKVYYPGDMVLVPPPARSTVWGMYKVKNTVAGATTIGQSPDVTPADWDQIGGGGGSTSISVWDNTIAYSSGDMVIIPSASGDGTWEMYRVSNAVIGTTTIGQSPDANTSPAEWDQIGDGPSNLTTISYTTGVVPENPAITETAYSFINPPTLGDIFINKPDGTLWFRVQNATGTKDVWEKHPEHAGVTELTALGQTPASNPPINPSEGDMVVNSASGSSWVYDANTTAWLALARTPTVTISRTTGETPGANPPAITSSVGDWYINAVDGTNWIYAVGGGGAAPGTAGWQPATPASGNVFLSDTAGEVPSSPTSKQTQFVFPTGTTLEEGDRFVNRTDHTNYVYAPDPASAGTLIWVKLPSDNSATVADTAGVVPENPRPGETTYVFTRPPKIGDIFVNRTDNQTWIRAANPSGVGDIWESISGSRVHVTDVPTQLPSDAIYVWKTSVPRAKVDWSVNVGNEFNAWSMTAQQGTDPSVIVTVNNTDGHIRIYNNDSVNGTALPNGRKALIHEYIMTTVGDLAMGSYHNDMSRTDDILSSNTGYVWFNEDGTLSIGHIDASGVRERFAVHEVGNATNTYIMQFSTGFDITTLANSRNRPANRGDEYVNTADKRNWVYDGSNWVERASISHFQVANAMSDLSTVADEGDLAYVKANKALHVYVPNPSVTGGYYWVRATPRGVAVTIQMRTGNNPTTVPPLGNAQVADWYINPTDKTSWMYAPKPAGGFGWTQIGFGDPPLPPLPRVHIVNSPGYNPEGTHYNIKPGSRPQINWQAYSNNPSLLTAWNAAAQGSFPKVFFNLTPTGSLEAYVDNPAVKSAAAGSPRGSDYYEIRLDVAGIAAAATKGKGDYNSMHGPNEGNADGGHYLWFNPDGTISIGEGGGGFARKVEWAMHIFGSGDTPLINFPLSKIGLTPSDLGVTQTIPAKEGDEYINTTDSRSWIHNGTKWVERVSRTTATCIGVIASTNTEMHEFLWSELDAAKISSWRPGSYLVVDHLEVGGKIPAGVMVIGGNVAEIGDWVMMFDGNNDGLADTLHLIRHDRPSTTTSSAGVKTGAEPPLNTRTTGMLWWNGGRLWIWDTANVWVEV